MAFLKNMMPAKVPIEVLWRLGVNLGAQSLPESLMLVVRAREQEIINVHNQEESHLAKEKARRMRRNGNTAQLGDYLLQVSFPVSSGFWMAV